MIRGTEKKAQNNKRRKSPRNDGRVSEILAGKTSCPWLRHTWWCSALMTSASGRDKRGEGSNCGPDCEGSRGGVNTGKCSNKTPTRTAAAGRVLGSSRGLEIGKTTRSAKPWERKTARAGAKKDGGHKGSPVGVPKRLLWHGNFFRYILLERQGLPKQAERTFSRRKDQHHGGNKCAYGSTRIAERVFGWAAE